MTKVYIAGPMAGHDDLNTPAFEAAEALLTELGFEPVSPHRVEPEDHSGPCPEYGYFPGESEAGHTSSACFMRPDLNTLLTCDGIYLLDGWQASRGATVEARRSTTRPRVSSCACRPLQPRTAPSAGARCPSSSTTYSRRVAARW